MLVSYVGFDEQEVSVGSNTVINVQLAEKAVGLDEVVITALGITQAKKAVGYSVQDFSGEQLSKVNALNVANLFRGQVSGLAVNNPTGIFQSPSLVLRGKTSLIVIDDISVSTNFFDLTASDIENVTVLKGTTASALYGSRGRNGAILISTRKAGKEGLEVVLANNTMVTAGFTVWPKTQTQYGNGSNGQYEFWDGQDGGVNDGDMIWGPKFEKGEKIAQWNSPIKDNVTGEIISWWGDVYGIKYDDKSRYSRVPIPWEYHNNLKDFLETGLVSTTDFSLSSKGEKVAQRFSASYTKQDGQVPNSFLHLGGLSYNSTVKISNNLTFDGKLSYNKVYSPSSHDGQLVVMHDNSVERTTNGKGNIQDLDYEYIRQLDAGSWKSAKYKGEKVPLLQEVYELCKGKVMINIDLKDVRAVPQLAKVTREMGMEDSVVITGQIPGSAKEIRENGAFLTMFYENDEIFDTLKKSGHNLEAVDHAIRQARQFLDFDTFISYKSDY